MALTLPLQPHGERQGHPFRALAIARPRPDHGAPAAVWAALGPRWPGAAASGARRQAMRDTIIGIIIGVVVGVVVGTTVIAPRLAPPPPPAPASKPAATAEPAVRWNMASAYGASLPQLGTLAKRVTRKIRRVSGGTLEITFHEPGTLVPPLETFDAVASGTVDAAFSSPGDWGDRIPALRLFSAVPFGPAAGEYLAWIYFGGGKELFDGILRRRNIHGVFCGLIAPEAAGWFRRQIRTFDDLEGVRMRAAGLGAKVLRKLGVQTRRLSGGDIFMALESGAIDAAEFSMPAIDLKLGFHQMARNYYFPGWHQPSTLFALMISLDRWDALSTTRKAQIEAVCGDNVRHGLAEGEALQFAALKELQAAGVRIQRWSDDILEALEAAWREVAAEEAAADADFATVWRSLTGFRDDYAIWKELGHP